jgi:Acetyltransferase (GNAT) domain
VPLLVEDVRTGEILGGGTFRNFDADGATVEIGYWLYPYARGRGVATRTARAFAERAFVLSVRCVVARVKVGNAASERVLERAGFTCDGVGRAIPTAHGRVAKSTWFCLWFRAMLGSIAGAVAAERSTHDVLYAAIIGASAAIVGGIVGGTIPGIFMLRVEDKRNRNAIELERRAVIGTARALREFFERVDDLYQDALVSGQWWSDELDAKALPLSLEDQKAVYGQLRQDEAQTIASSLRLIVFVRARRQAAIAGGASKSLQAADKAQLESGRHIAQLAAECIRRVADLPPAP